MRSYLISKARTVLSFYRVLQAVWRHPLHRSRRIAAVVDWLRLQAAINLTPTNQITVPYVGGAVLSWPKEASSVMICARYGLGEYADMAFCLHLLRPDDLFCDVGANAGVYTVLAARAVGCKVVAAEPVPQTHDLLMQNIFANGVSSNVDARRNGVGRIPGHLNFTANLWSYNHVVDQADENTVQVEVLPLDTILAGRRATAIKIDVEGFEAEVLAGAAATLSAPELQAVIIEMYDGHVEKYNSKLDDIRQMLAAAGLSGPYWYEPDGRNLTQAGAWEERKYNQLFIRDHAFVSNRLRESKRYEIHGTSV